MHHYHFGGIKGRRTLREKGTFREAVRELVEFSGNHRGKIIKRICGEERYMIQTRRRTQNST